MISQAPGSCDPILKRPKKERNQYPMPKSWSKFVANHWNNRIKEIHLINILKGSKLNLLWSAFSWEPKKNSSYWWVDTNIADHVLKYRPYSQRTNPYMDVVTWGRTKSLLSLALHTHIIYSPTRRWWKYRCLARSKSPCWKNGFRTKARWSHCPCPQYQDGGCDIQVRFV